MVSFLKILFIFTSFILCLYGITSLDDESLNETSSCSLNPVCEINPKWLNLSIYLNNMNYEKFPSSRCFNVSSNCVDNEKLAELNPAKHSCYEPSDYISAYFDFDFFDLNTLIVLIDLDDFETLINENNCDTNSSYSTELSFVFEEIPKSQDIDGFYNYSGITNQEDKWRVIAKNQTELELTWKPGSWYDIKWKVKITNEKENFSKSIGQSYIKNQELGIMYETGKNIIYIRQIGIDFLIFGKLYSNLYFTNSSNSTFNELTLINMDTKQIYRFNTNIVETKKDDEYSSNNNSETVKQMNEESSPRLEWKTDFYNNTQMNLKEMIFKVAGLKSQTEYSLTTMDWLENPPQLTNVIKFTTLKDPEVSIETHDTQINFGATLFGGCSHLKDYMSNTEYTYFNMFSNDTYIGKIYDDTNKSVHEIEMEIDKDLKPICIGNRAIWLSNYPNYTNSSTEVVPTYEIIVWKNISYDELPKLNSRTNYSMNFTFPARIDTLMDFNYNYNVSDKSIPKSFFTPNIIRKTYLTFILVVIASTVAFLSASTFSIIWAYKRQKAAAEKQFQEEMDKMETNLLYQKKFNKELKKLTKLNLSDLLILIKIGDGEFGQVYKGTLKKEDEKEPILVAIKQLKDGANDNAKLELIREAHLLKSAQHENLIKFYGIVFDEKESSTFPEYIVLEYMNKGDLLSYLRSDESKMLIDYANAIKIFIDIANGCKYLESLNFVHRDLAARNCLVNIEHDETKTDIVVKIGDFGLARETFSVAYYRQINWNKPLPIRWMAPESLEEVNSLFTVKSDVWAFGVVMWEIITFGLLPYSDKSNPEVISFVKEGRTLSVPSCINPNIKTLIESCWKFEKEERPTFKALYGSLKDIQKSKLDEPLYSNDVMLAWSKKKDIKVNDSYSKVASSKND